jgi:hypothetical protein
MNAAFLTVATLLTVRDISGRVISARRLRFRAMSALPPKADMVQHGGNVRFVPKDGVIMSA